MALMNKTEFEALTGRGVLHHRSRDLSDIASKLYAHHTTRSSRSIVAVSNALTKWRKANPAEYASRNGLKVQTALEKQIRDEVRFLRNLDIARIACNAIYDERRANVVNDADTSASNRAELKGSLFAALKTRLKPDVSAASMKDRIDDPVYWAEKGAAVAADAEMKIRCGESAALVTHVLRKTKGFQLPVAIVEQGRGSIDGHFWVVAGPIVNRTPAAGRTFGDDTFVIDLWGVATRHTTNIILGPPGERPFDMRSNAVRIRASW